MSPKHKTRSKTATKAARHAIKNSRTEDQKSLDKKVMQSLVATVLEKEQEMKTMDKARLPKGYYENLVKRFIPIIPTLTVKSLKNAVFYHRSNKSIVVDPSDNTTNSTVTEEQVPTVQNSMTKPARQGRPRQSFIRNNKIAYSIAMNEVTSKAEELKKKEGLLRDVSLKTIVNEVREKMNLPTDFEIKKITIKRRIQRKRTVVEAHECMGGLDTPLAEIEPSIVEIVLCMSKLRQSLTCNQITHLVNSCIDGTPYQKNLIAFKIRHKIDQPEEKLGKVGANYT